VIIYPVNDLQQEVSPADKIQSIRSTASGSNRCLFLIFSMGGDIFTRYRLSADQVFCRGIGET
jgi:hypothetical protein